MKLDVILPIQIKIFSFDIEVEGGFNLEIDYTLGLRFSKNKIIIDYHGEDYTSLNELYGYPDWSTDIDNFVKKQYEIAHQINIKTTDI